MRRADQPVTSTTGDFYDGAGQRVEQQVTAGGRTTTTVYVGSMEVVGITTHYSAGGRRLALAGTWPSGIEATVGWATRRWR